MLGGECITPLCSLLLFCGIGLFRWFMGSLILWFLIGSKWAGMESRERDEGISSQVSFMPDFRQWLAVLSGTMLVSGYLCPFPLQDPNFLMPAAMYYSSSSFSSSSFFSLSFLSVPTPPMAPLLNCSFWTSHLFFKAVCVCGCSVKMHVYMHIFMYMGACVCPKLMFGIFLNRSPLMYWGRVSSWMQSFSNLVVLASKLILGIPYSG